MENYTRIYGYYIEGNVQWKKLADELGYSSGEALRSKFKRERKKRGDPSRVENVGVVLDNSFSNGGNVATTFSNGCSVTTTEAPVYRETVEIKEDGKIHSNRLIEIEAMDLRTPEKLLEAHGFDPDKWVLVNAINNYWNGMRPKDAGLVSLYQSKIIVKPKLQTDLSLKDIETFFNTFKPENISIPVQAKQYEQGGLVLEIDLADVHVGNESISFEDLKRRIEHLVFEIIRRSEHLVFEKICLVQLGDILHFDNYQRQTTSGTQITYGSNFSTMYENAISLVIWVIDELSKISKVELINIYGNHDKINSYTLAKVIEAYYRNNDNVEIDATPNNRKFRKFGISSVAFVHGDMPKANIYDTFQKEERKLFGETDYSEIHLGHLHHEISLEKSGVIVRYVPSVTLPDQWHDGSGYTGSKQGTHCFVWDLKHGLSDIWMIPCGERHL